MGVGAAAATVAAAVSSVAASVSTAVASISLATIAEGAAIGAGLGGLEAAITGRPILRGALEGGTIGAATGGLGSIGTSLTGSGILGGALGGAAAGAAGSAAFGDRPLLGAVSGGLGGAAAGAAGAFDTSLPSAPVSDVAYGGGVGALETGSGKLASGAAQAGGNAQLGMTLAEDVGALPSAGAGTSGPLPGASAAATPASVPLSGTSTGIFDANVYPAAYTTSTPAPANAPLGSVIGGVDAQGNLLPDTPAPTPPAPTAPTAPPPDATSGPGPTQGGWTPQDATNQTGFPIPPQPPMLDPAGNPVVTADGTPVYGSPGEAQYAGSYNQQAAAGFPTPAQPANSIAAAFSTPTWDTISNALSNNASWLVPAAGMGTVLMRQAHQQPYPNQNALQGQATALNTQGQQLQSYLQSGNLPPGLQQAINQGSEAAKATIRSQYAARGMSGSSAEAQDLANVDQRAQSQGAQLAVQLFQTGMTETGMATGIYQSLLGQSIQQDQALSQAIGNFTASLVPRSTGNVTINTGAAA